MTDADTFDTPDNAEVLQEDIVMPAVPVEIEGVVRVDEMPTKLGSCRAVLLPRTTRAQMVLPRDPRRKRVILWPCVRLDSEETLVCISNNESDANQFIGVLLESGPNAVARYEFSFQDEIYARPCIINDTAGVVTGMAASTQDVILSVVSEQWAN
jgi:hypothetical protein